MSSEIHLNMDFRLNETTIMASFATAERLRQELGDGQFDVLDSETHSDDVVSVPPELYDAFAYYLDHREQFTRS
ncbi:MAG: hypothetical protein HUJ26_02140 [Planctomycetaceae bacterium]|nr:hypothetical protein [Planctomycetaceae bacterium]